MTTAAGRLGATRASATLFLIPVVALALGVSVRGEQVAPLSIVGAAVCLAGAWLIRPRSVSLPVAPAAECLAAGRPTA
jgi:drug/metabolite transporter (DMT)-like permease